MLRSINSYFINITGIIAVGLIIYILFFGQLLQDTWSLTIPKSFLQLNTIFISILIEAIPFILIGVIIAGFIQIFITEEHIKRWIPKNKYLAIVMSCVVGALFPACECGIVPIVRRLVSKGVPLYAAVGFLLTGPLINPIVILSTYMAFGNDIKIASLRMGIGFFAALVIAFSISFLFKSNQLKTALAQQASTIEITKQDNSLMKKIHNMIKHSIDEFFDMSKYLIIGAFIAAALQTFVTMKSLFIFGEGLISTTIIMMGLAYFLSLCSEADAFIGASFRNLVPKPAILSFLIYGPMIDLKNTIMLLSAFKARFVLALFIVISVVVFIFSLLSSNLF
ncbi:hypothetical protein CIB95_07920 [Lottiidibacillus patelloidae]|uniref:Permease n=1 Tax=Lottiidibacillus patelloidae TaxID=2670334 RepID=A0A263BUH9_9BACI|nr:permease [Lottiidibacillus patelloidae]OZM57379.1 hypothetical protein CIB95_07920 [Lottiidibacillus patelloidae]